jgi:alanine dehydrogenase
MTETHTDAAQTAPIVIRNEAAKSLVTVAEAIEPMRAAFAAMGAGEAETGARYRFPIERGFMQWGPARWDDHDRFGYKVWANSGSPLSGAWINLYEASTGRLLAVIEAHHTSLCRTAAVSVVAAQTVIPAGSSVTVGLYGTGRQARGQIEAMCVGYDVRSARIYGRDAERREAFAREVAKPFSVQTIACADPSEVPAGADIVVTATSASEPVVKGAWLDGVRVVCAMGANRIYEREVDQDGVTRMGSIIVDDLEEAQTCCGDLIWCVEHGQLNWPSTIELGHVLTRGTKLREPVLFESQGLSLTDIAIADYVYRKALESGTGFDGIELT